MSDDALKALLMADEPAPAPANDVAFTLEVMNKVARRRLIEGVILLVAGAIVVSALLYVVMPAITPALSQMAAPLMPVVGILAALAVLAFTWEQLRPALRQYGLPI